MSVSVTAIPRDFYIAAFSLFLCGTEFDWKRCADLWRESFSHPAFNLSLPCWDDAGWKWQQLSPVCSWGSSTAPVSVPYKYCYFSCLVCWGTAFGLFFLQKGRKANLEKYCSHVISNYLAVVPGTGLLTASRRRVGETQLQPTRRKREKDPNLPWASLALPCFPLHLLLSLGSQSYYFTQSALPILHRTASPRRVQLSVQFLPPIKWNIWRNQLALGGKNLLGIDVLLHLQ